MNGNHEKECSPEDVALKTFFLGPQSENAEYFNRAMGEVLTRWLRWRTSQYPKDGRAITAIEQQSPEFQERLHHFNKVLMRLEDQFHSEIPKFSPRYIGHMFSESSLPALLGHFLCLLHNPNNIAKESSRVGIALEKCAIRDLSDMFAYPQTSVGHFTSGGTVANYEALLRAKLKWKRNILQNWNRTSDLSEASYANSDALFSPAQLDESDWSFFKKLESKFNVSLKPPVILAPASAHYCWPKAMKHMGYGAESVLGVELDSNGRMKTSDLKEKIEECLFKRIPILGIVSVCGTTEMGTIDPIHEVQNLLDSFQGTDGYTFWHHIDAAYGGFFSSLKDSTDPRVIHFKADLRAVSRAQSITVDPHKLGYVPYSCGAFLCRDPDDYPVPAPGAPYVDFNPTSDLGQHTIEGSRAATGAAAMKMTADCIGLNEEGFGRILLRAMKTADLLEKEFQKVGLPIVILPVPRTNILCFSLKLKGTRSIGEMSAQTEQLIERIQNSSDQDQFFISRTRLTSQYHELIQKIAEQNQLDCDEYQLWTIRLTIMNPFISSTHTNYIQDLASFLKARIMEVTRRD